MDFKFIKLYLLLSVLIITLVSCCPPFCRKYPPEPYSCSGSGGYGIFVAKFDADAVGALPTTTFYGPPGANLEIENGTNTVEVVNSAVLASKALKITRPNGYNPSIVKGIAGNLGGQTPYTSGKYYISFRAHGEVIPEHLIAGIAISVLSEEGDIALDLKLFDGSYHLLENNQYNRLAGSYNPATKHKVHIFIDMDIRRFSICIDEIAVVMNKPISNGSFSNVAMLHFFAAGTVTEAFQMLYVIDDIRITK